MSELNLDERARVLEEKKNQLGKGKNPIYAIRLDLVKNIINEIESNNELRDIFGEPVSGKLALVSDKEDASLSIGEACLIELDDLQKIKFLKSMREIFDRNLEGTKLRTP
jgi:hypothetical protein